jgi:hypothetical protein
MFFEASVNVTRLHSMTSQNTVFSRKQEFFLYAYFFFIVAMYGKSIVFDKIV